MKRTQRSLPLRVHGRTQTYRDATDGQRKGRVLQLIKAHLFLILESAHLALPFLLVAFVACDGGEAVQGARCVRAGLAASLTTKCYTKRSDIEHPREARACDGPNRLEA